LGLGCPIEKRHVNKKSPKAGYGKQLIWLMSIMLVVMSFGEAVSPFKPQQRFTSYLVGEMV